MVRMDSTRKWNDEVYQKAGTGIGVEYDASVGKLTKCTLDNSTGSRWLVMELLNTDGSVKATYVANPGQTLVKTLVGSEQSDYTVVNNAGAGGNKTALNCPHRIYYSEVAPLAPLTGLDWDGLPPGRRAIIFTSPPPAYPMTYIWKVYPRLQVTNRPDGNRYYTTFFHGNNGAFVWADPGYANSYYGFHPYPRPPDLPNPGNGKWEISVATVDLTDRDDLSSPFVTNDRWYSQAAVVNASGGNLNQKFYIDLPSTSTANTITGQQAGATYSTPTTPCIIWGQAPDDGSGLQSWGGYTLWEEHNGRIRGVQIYSSALSEAHILALASKDYDADVLSYCVANGITPWYLNMNWTLTDITDKSGSGNNPAWVGSDRPTLWTA